MDKQRVMASLVHLYTSSGLLWAVLAALSIEEGDYRSACFWLIVAMAVDSTDGFLARRFAVRRVLPQIDGRRLDDIIDYLNYSFVPLLMVARAGWIPEPVYLWITIPLVTSVFGFCHQGAKQEQDGFFRGFPSYWNIVAIYLFLGFKDAGTLFTLAVLLLLSLLTVLPVRFLYPSHAVYGKRSLISSCIAWIVGLLYLLYEYPEVPGWLLWITAIYPAFYFALSFYLDYQVRRSRHVKA